MDEQLIAQLEEVKKRLEVYEGESPATKVADAIRLMERNGLLYRYAQNGNVWELRWSIDHPVIQVHESRVCDVICKRIIEIVPSRIPASTSKTARRQRRPK